MLRGVSSEVVIGALERAGLGRAELDEFVQSGAFAPSSFEAAGQALSLYLSRGIALGDRLPSPVRRSADEREAAALLGEALTAARERFLRRHAGDLYDALTDRRSRSVRIEVLVRDAAELVPGLVPSEAQMAAERTRPLADKRGFELSQGLLVSHVLARPDSGGHLIASMHEPTPPALSLVDRFCGEGVVDLEYVRIARQGRAAVIELRNPRHLNAEDEFTIGPTETAVDLVLLDPETEICVLRGSVLEHRRYAGERVFGSGINLTHLYQGSIDFLWYLIRDLGYVSKIYRGVWREDGVVEKLWVAAVERYAIGGACQLLHVVDHVIAVRGSRLYLPARKEGIIPGASNLRLARSVGDRAARQAILSGREWTAGEPDADLIVDEVVEPGEMDGALAGRIEALTSSGLINAAANRRALRVGAEPIDVFRDYMSTYAREQAFCHLSPALVTNLERHWNAHERLG